MHEQRRGKHSPGQKKGKGAPAGNARGKGAWCKGKGKGKISEVDDSGWAHVGPPQEWNWASGSQWAAAPAEAAPQLPPAVASEAAPPPWIVAAQQQPQWSQQGPPAATGAMRSMSGPTAGGFQSFAPARVRTKTEISVTTANRFFPLDDQGREHRREVTLADYVMNPKKPRRGKGVLASMGEREMATSVASRPT